MRKSEASVWQQIPEGKSPKNGYLGFVFFRSDENCGGVMYSDVADPTLSLGENFWLRLGVSSEDKQRLRDLMFETDAVWLLSKLGVGLLYKRYDLWTGYYLYVHFHDDPRALTALLARGRLLTYSPVMAVHGIRKKTENLCDDATAMRFSEALEQLQAMKQLLEKPPEEERLSVDHFCHIAHEAARLVGFSLVTENHENYSVSVPDHYARLLEGLLLYWLGLTSMLSENRRVKLADEKIVKDGEQILTLSFSTMVNREDLLEITPRRYQLFLNYDHMVYKSEISGVHTYWTADEPVEEAFENQDVTSDSQPRCLELTFHVEMTKDPFRDASPAFKVATSLIYDDEN